MQTDTALTRHLRAILEHQGQGLVDRQDTLRLALLGALSGHNVLLLGPPGTAKSLVARRLAGAFGQATRFEYLLTRFTTPDELFGPVSIKALKEKDQLRRNTAGYLPTAQVVFLDEIFKAGSAILNALLTLLNERVFFNGAQIEPAPLLVLVAASNEVPQGGELQALYDRFPLRVLVGPVSGDADFERLLTGTRGPEPLLESARLSPQDVALLRAARDEVGISTGAFAVLKALRAALAEGPAEQWQRRYVSDRRWTQVVDLLRTSASAHGQSQVQVADCGLLRHCLWNDPQDAPDIADLVDKVLEEHGVGLDLELGSVGVRWRQLLESICLHDNALSARVDHYELQAGERRFVLTPKERQAWAQNTWDSVQRSGGLYWDGQDFRQLQSAGRQGAGRRSWILGDWAVATQEMWDKVHGHQEPSFDDAVVVSLRALRGQGAVVDLSAVPGPTRTRWLGQLGVLSGALEAQDAQRGAMERQVAAMLLDHLFLDAQDTAGLSAGLARAEVEIQAWRDRMEELQQALMDGGRWSSAELPLPA